MFIDYPFDSLCFAIAMGFCIIILSEFGYEAHGTRLSRKRIKHLALAIPLLIFAYGTFTLPYHLNFAVAAASILVIIIATCYLNFIEKTRRQTYREIYKEYSYPNESLHARLQELRNIKSEFNQHRTKVRNISYCILLGLAAIQSIALVACHWGPLAIPFGVFNFSVAGIAAVAVTPFPVEKPFFSYGRMVIFCVFLVADILMYFIFCGVYGAPIIIKDPAAWTLRDFFY